MPHATTLERYHEVMSSDGFVSDAAQLAAVERLNDCQQALQQPETSGVTQGVYLWGPVGRGKTWLMDIFYRSLVVPARRQHFHHFMRWVHMRLFQLNGTADPLKALARELSESVRVLCFDELFVGDIGDAIILGRLFQEMFEQGVVIVATSNQPPDQLYADGFNRERFLPAIGAIEQHMQIIKVSRSMGAQIIASVPVWRSNVIGSVIRGTRERCARCSTGGRLGRLRLSPCPWAVAC